MEASDLLWLPAKDDCLSFFFIVVADPEAAEEEAFFFTAADDDDDESLLPRSVFDDGLSAVLFAVRSRHDSPLCSRSTLCLSSSLVLSLEADVEAVDVDGPFFFFSKRTPEDCGLRAANCLALLCRVSSAAAAAKALEALRG